MNEEQKERARKVLDQVEREPESLYMACWVVPEDDGRRNWKTGEPVPGCGTTRCIAGWLVYNEALPGEESHGTRRRVAGELGLSSGAYDVVGAALLGLTPQQARDLFFEDDEREAVEMLRAYVEG